MRRSRLARRTRTAYPRRHVSRVQVWQLMLGGVGQPSLQKLLVPTDAEPFDVILSAITSNSRERQGNGQCILLLERAE